MRSLFLLFLSLSSVSAGSKPDQGWHWYQSRPTLKDPPTPETMESYRRQVQESLDRAILNPTPETIGTYMKNQKELMDRSMAFAKVWQKVLLTTPELNPDIEHPTTQKGRHLYLDARHQKIRHLIQELSKTHGLFFFFKEGCVYCKAFAAVVKHFSETYGWSVLAISLDGSSLDEFPEAQRDNGTAQKLGVYEKGVPALMAVDPKAGRVIPLSYGFISETQLLDNIRLWLEGDAE